MFLTFKNKIKKIRKNRFETGLKPVFKPVFREPVFSEPVFLEPVFRTGSKKKTGLPTLDITKVFHFWLIFSKKPKINRNFEFHGS